MKAPALPALFNWGKVPTGIVLGLAFGLFLFEGSSALIGWFAWAMLLVACWELAALLGKTARQRLVLAAAAGLAALLSRWLLSSNRAAVDEFMFLALLLWTVIGPLALLRERPVAPVPAAVLYCFALVSAWLSLAILVEYDRWLLIAGITAVCLSDAGAQLAGKRLGRTPMAPRLSPRKTWEGALGALLMLYCYATILWWLFLQDSIRHWLALLLVTGIAALGMLGDLAVSRLKRQAGVKDTGALLGSHGGLLDRIDSWLPVLPFLALMSSLLA